MATTLTSIFVFLASVSASSCMIGPGFLPFFGPRPFLPFIRPPFLGPLLPPILPPPILPSFGPRFIKNKIIRPSPPVIINRPTSTVFVPGSSRRVGPSVVQKQGGNVKDKLTINLIDSRRDGNRDIYILGLDELGRDYDSRGVIGGAIGGIGAVGGGAVAGIGGIGGGAVGGGAGGAGGSGLIGGTTTIIGNGGFDNGDYWNGWDGYGGGNEISVDGNLVINNGNGGRPIPRSTGNFGGVGKIEYDYGLNSMPLDAGTAAVSLDPIAASAPIGSVGITSSGPGALSSSVGLV